MTHFFFVLISKFFLSRFLPNLQFFIFSQEALCSLKLFRSRFTFLDFHFTIESRFMVILTVAMIELLVKSILMFKIIIKFIEVAAHI
jgi:hypothetical protein